MEFFVKKELVELPRPKETTGVSKPVPVIDLSSSDSDDSEDSGDSDYDVDDIIGDNGKRSVVLDGLSEANLKKQRMEKERVVLPAGFLDPLTPMEPSSLLRRHSPSAQNANASTGVISQNLKQFWKAGDYEGAPYGKWDSSSVGIDHVRVHPKFLHSNATSHKWALGAFAELLDNALDETCSGATYVNIDMLENKKDGNKMLLIEDNGGGMDPDKMRQCMSLGYSIKSKIANTIGQYGNGFKTSTMRLGADVIVFSRCCGKDGISPTQSIGLLSYTFLRSTGKEDIVVPMLDYKRGVREWNKLIRSTPGDWNKNVETIEHWSPFSSEADLLQQFNLMKDHGTRIIIYNLWEDDEELLELDFDSDKHDIQLRGVNRDEKNIKMAQENPNSRHFLTYRHSLRSYASILYLRLPPGFRIILRGIDVEHHNIVNDMMRIQEITYRPQPSADGIPKEANGMATVTIGFVKDAKNHLDVQGFNVYHKNRLIKPFWRLWNASGSDGRGVIGVVEANFVEPAHDKQDFERTTVLARLEARLVLMQKHYWSTNCHEIGYAPRRHKSLNSDYRETSPDYTPPTYSQHKNKGSSSMGRSSKTVDGKYGNGHVSRKTVKKSVNRSNSSEPSSPSSKDNNDDDMQGALPERQMNGSSHKTFPAERSSEKYATGASRPSSEKYATGASRPSSFVHISEARQDFGSGGTTVPATISLQAKGNAFNGNEDSMSNFHSFTIDQLKEENRELKERLKKKEAEVSKNLQLDLLRERERCRSLETQLQEKQRKIEEMNREQETLIDIFSEERDRRDIEEENLRKKLKDASNTIQELLDKVRLLERR